MKSRLVLGLSALALVAAAQVGCFTDYHDDCNRNPELDCFWGVSGGGGTGGAGGTTTDTTATPSCGDGHQDPGEACDDGNTADCDGCRGDCSAKETGCGDAFVCAPETCDNGSSNSNTGACTLACHEAACGDGFLQDGEECDDGNTASGDNCSKDCKVECVVGSLPYGNVKDHYEILFDQPSLHCYVHIKQPQKSWAGAQTACKGWGGDLFAFSDVEEATLVAGAFPTLSGQAWVGGNDKVQDTVFEWSNGEPWPDTSFWAQDEPNLPGPGCVAMDNIERLYDFDCGSVLGGGYICELDLATLK